MHPGKINRARMILLADCRLVASESIKSDNRFSVPFQPFDGLLNAFLFLSLSSTS